jgi:hypothetical protein
MIIQTFQETGSGWILRKFQPQAEIDKCKQFVQARKDEASLKGRIGTEWQHVAEIPKIEVMKHPEILSDADMMDIYLRTEGADYVIAKTDRFRGRAKRIMSFDVDGNRTDGGIIIAS